MWPAISTATYWSARRDVQCSRGHLSRYQICGQHCGAASTQNSSTSDVRQGCPLSPYLFIILTTAVMADSVGTSDDLPCHDIAFADDTNLISQSVQDLTRLLHSVESRAAEDGLEVAA